MPLMNHRDQYGWVTKFFHWLLFLLIAGLLGSGLYSDSLDRPDKIPMMINNHKQVGIAVLGLMAFRFLWRLINMSVESFSNSSILRFLSWLTHWLMYLVVMAQALCGILMVQAGNRTVYLLDWQLPHLVGQHGLLGINIAGKVLRQWHEYGGMAILALLGLHIIAALLHHFYWDDDTLRRMWFGYKPSYLKETRSSRV